MFARHKSRKAYTRFTHPSKTLIVLARPQSSTAAAGFFVSPILFFRFLDVLISVQRVRSDPVLTNTLFSRDGGHTRPRNRYYDLRRGRVFKTALDKFGFHIEYFRCDSCFLNYDEHESDVFD